MQSPHCNRHPHYDQDCQLCEAASVVNEIQALRARLNERDLVVVGGFPVYGGNVIATPPRAMPREYFN